MKLLELTNYSSGICGVWQRVKQESEFLSKAGHEVKIFSSNLVKGSKEFASEIDNLGEVSIQRFPARILGGESFMKWNFEKEAMAYSPDIIIAHGYRHPHTTKAIKLAKKIHARVFLVTHAPFERELTRTPLQNLIVWIYDKFIGSKKLNDFDYIIAITRWEVPYLLNLGVDKNKIIYIPNGIPQDFFDTKQSKEKSKILFLGRISPIKNLEILINSFKYLKDKKIYLEIVGPSEGDYLSYLKRLIREENLEKRIKFYPPIFDLKEKIEKIDSSQIFVLPSKSEGMPQSLIEAMARKKIIIGSKIISIRDLIQDKKTGYLFNLNDSRDLANKIDLALLKNKKNKEIRKNAKTFVKQFSWNKLINNLEELF